MALSSGLTPLEGLDSVIVGQKATLVKNKYAVLTPDGNVLFYAKEEGNFLGSMFAGNKRSFEIDIFDTQDRLVSKLRRPFTIGAEKMEVTIEGQLSFIVRKELTMIKPVLKVNDSEDRLLYKVKGPAMTSGEADFEVKDPNKTHVGVIHKKWGGFRELVTSADSFHIQFPHSMPVQHKMGLIATCFLIDFLYYDK